MQFDVRSFRLRSSIVPGFLVVLGVLLAIFPSHADYSEHPAALELAQQMQAEHGLEQTQVLGILKQASTEQRILDSMANAAEKTKTWTAYRKSFLSPVRVSKGAEFMRRHAELLANTEAATGVPAEIITAILGVETNYGGYTGKANVLNALATLAFEHPRRSKFFTSELKHFILLSRERDWDPTGALGSYAGAMGWAQFMPSNYRTLAVDGDGDGDIDLHSVADAVASVANYFVHHGWRNAQPVAGRVAVAEGFDETLIKSRGLRPDQTVEALEAAGYHPQRPVAGDTEARIVRFRDLDGDEIWFGYHNFYVISRYNPRAKYAMAVYHLSQEIDRSYRELLAAR